MRVGERLFYRNAWLSPPERVQSLIFCRRYSFTPLNQCVMLSLARINALFQLEHEQYLDAEKYATWILDKRLIWLALTMTCAVFFIAALMGVFTTLMLPCVAKKAFSSESIQQLQLYCSMIGATPTSITTRDLSNKETLMQYASCINWLYYHQHHKKLSSTTYHNGGTQ